MFFLSTSRLHICKFVNRNVVFVRPVHVSKVDERLVELCLLRVALVAPVHGQLPAHSVAGTRRCEFLVSNESLG